MKRNWIARAGAAGVVVAGLMGPALGQDAVGVDAPAEVAVAPAPWLRMAEERDGEVLRLQVAVREFVHADPERPRITIAGAVHIGEPEFYEELQAILDAKDVVLFEGVQSRRAQGAETDDARVVLTRSRMRILASMLDAYRSEHGEYPEDIEGLLKTWPDASLAKNPTDAWGNLLIYYPENEGEPRFEIVSLGADGKAGGEGAAAELRMSSVEDRPAPRQRPEGIQKQMADAMGLVFQLEAMSHDGPNWRNSDMAVEDLRERFKDSGVEAESLFKMMDGSSMMGRFSGMLLSMMGATEQSRGMLKAMMIEVLSNADRLMEQMPGSAGRMMAVLIDDRNEVVIADLKKLFETEPQLRTVGIIYGAGHLAHMEQRLIEDFGYEASESRWLTAMEVDTVEAGIPVGQLRTMRQMIQRSLEAQTQRRR